jgi:hypothetical protein
MISYIMEEVTVTRTYNGFTFNFTFTFDFDDYE